MAAQPRHHLTVEEYLEDEDRALERHEYLNGEIFPMPGGSIEHATIGTNIVIDLGAQLSETSCIVRGPDARIRTSPSGLYTYADVSVSCGQTLVENTALVNPVLVVEVLSERTQGYDRGKKFELYRQIETFGEYLIVRKTESTSNSTRKGRIGRCGA